MVSRPAAAGPAAALTLPLQLPLPLALARALLMVAIVVTAPRACHGRALTHARGAASSSPGSPLAGSPSPSSSGDLGRGGVVSVADFGALANSSADSCLAFNRSIEAARRQKAAVLRIPKGVYHLHWHSCPSASIFVSNTVTLDNRCADL